MFGVRGVEYHCEMKSQLRECIAIDSGVCYLFHTWIRKTNSDGEILVAVVEDSVGLMHEVKADNLQFT